MTKNRKPMIRAAAAALIALTALAIELSSAADIAPNYHSYYEPASIRPVYAASAPVVFDYGVSDTTAGYLVPGIEVRVLRFRKNDEDIYGSYDSFRRTLKPVAAGLFQYGLLVVLALFAVVWLAVALNRWQKPVHVPNRRHTAETRHLAYLIRRQQINRNLPDKGRKL